MKYLKLCIIFLLISISVCSAVDIHEDMTFEQTLIALENLIGEKGAMKLLEVFYGIDSPPIYRKDPSHTVAKLEELIPQLKGHLAAMREDKSMLSQLEKRRTHVEIRSCLIYSIVGLMTSVIIVPIVGLFLPNCS